MRLLNEHHRGSHVDKIDGMKIHLDNDEWVHVLPNPDSPLFRGHGRGRQPERAADLAAEYRGEIESYIDFDE